MTTLQTRVAETLMIAEKYKGRNLTEQDTKNALIEPVLAALGWPKFDLERVRAEYRQTSKSNPVDYALLSDGRPVMFVEAKALDKSIEEHRFVAQVLSYANVAGVDWALITNGYQWDLYSVFARVQASQKRFFTTTLADEGFCEWMAWITPGRLEGNELERYWRLVFAERRVRTTINRLFAERNDSLLSLLAGEAGLEIADVAMALQSLQPGFEIASMDRLAQLASAAPTPPTPPRPVVKRVKATSRRPRKKPAPRLLKPPSGRKPVALQFGGTRYPLESWRDLLAVTLEHLRGLDSVRYQRIFEAPEFQGRVRRYFTRDPTGLKQPRAITGGYLEANQSAASVVRLTEDLLDFFEVQDPVSYEVR